ncbi:MAG: DUF4405 domain-containing protein [Phycisphaerales bacterium]|nr:MAG: DUF4405 domain-containing protein [Phycisphaerales bacterium]
MMGNSGPERRIHAKGFTSFLLGTSLTVLAVSGVVLYFTPQGRVANWTGWTMGGLSKYQWEAVHMTSALLFVIAALVHLYLNWLVFWGYIRSKSGARVFNMKWEAGLAVVVAAIFVVGTLSEWQPFATIMAWNADIKAYWAQRYEGRPYPDAENSSLERLASRLGLNINAVLGALRAEGLAVEDPTATVATLAEAHGMTPGEVFRLLSGHFPSADFGAGRGWGRGQGRGRGMRGQGRGQWQGRGRAN